MSREFSLERLNKAIQYGFLRDMIHMSEAVHEHGFSDIADEILQRGDVKLVLVAGPSSSGKTTSSKRLALHLRVNRINPVVIEMDNYFLDRDKTPLDENGDYDYETVYALDLDLLNDHLQKLSEGEEVEIPNYNFALGKKEYRGNKIKLKENDIVVMEGIHALNPVLTSGIDDSMKYKLYVAPLSRLKLDWDNDVTTFDNRLLRRMVRDYQFRGISPEGTILRWPKVRAGEQKYIYPYKELADSMFNSSLMYELPLLKCYAEPRLKGITPNSPVYEEAQRILDFLTQITPIIPSDLNAIPPTSIAREFIGGSSLTY
ncbi:MAG: nucleoside kinase [Bacteroidales bacterium]|nr:nucleoside kinase [Bacteroidales bacterium]